MSDTEKASPKLGAGSLQAMGRMGLHEFRNAFYAGSNVATHTEAGMWGTALPSEVAAQRQDELQPGEPASPSVIDSRIKEADRQAQATPEDRGPQPRGMERE